MVCEWVDASLWMSTHIAPQSGWLVIARQLEPFGRGPVAKLAIHFDLTFSTASANRDRHARQAFYCARRLMVTRRSGAIDAPGTDS